MKISIFIIVTLLSSCSTIQNNNVANQIDHEKYDSRYNELIFLVEQKASLEEFKELREIYIFTSHYKPYSSPERSLSQTMSKAMNSGDWSSCLDNAKKILEFNYISLSAHYGSMECSFESEDKAKGERHKYILDSLLDAIWATGDGKSIETAFYCTSTPELQAFIQLNGLDTVDQALIHHEGRSYDLMGVKNPKDGKEFQLYFDISAQWALGFQGLK